jgi:DNA-binding Lrp family transcriptional regulator
MPQEKIVAYVLLVTEIGREHEVAEQAKKLDEDAVVETTVVYGEYDVVVKIETDSLRKIDKIVTQLRRLDSVLKTVTLVGS